MRTIETELTWTVKLRQTSVTYMGHKLSVRSREGTCRCWYGTPWWQESCSASARQYDVPGQVSSETSAVAEPLRWLTDAETHFEWFEHHTDVLKEIKHMLTNAVVLKYFDEMAETTIYCDASEKGLGATLLQNGQPITFASRALSHTEQCYAQIVKECLAIVFACERFDHYIQGRKVTIETDHKPLVPIFVNAIHGAPKRLQKMLLWLQKYQLDVTYKPGKEVLIADWLSRSESSYRAPTENLHQWLVRCWSQRNFPWQPAYITCPRHSYSKNHQWERVECFAFMAQLQ